MSTAEWFAVLVSLAALFLAVLAWVRVSLIADDLNAATAALRAATRELRALRRTVDPRELRALRRTVEQR